MKEDQKIIQHALWNQSKELNLSRYFLDDELEEIPDGVFNLRQLETLNLIGNNIKEVPERIRNLINLKQLNVIGNPMEKLPDIPGLYLSWDTYLNCWKTSREKT